MSSQAAELARRLARDAEAVCRHYLSNGRREGRYWLVGDVRNTPGRSLFVRLHGPDSGKGAAGHMDRCRHRLSMAIFSTSSLSTGASMPSRRARRGTCVPAPATTGPAPDRTRRASFHAAWLAGGCPPSVRHVAADRRHTRQKRICGDAASRLCTQRTASASTHAATIARTQYSPIETWPALIAAVTDLAGRITGVHRTWLDPSGAGKAPIDTPRRAMGHLLGHGVRFGVASDILAAGEGIETMLSLRMALPVHAHDRRTLRQPPRRHPVPVSAAAPLHCARRRSSRRRSDGKPDRPSPRGRHRRDRAVADGFRTSTMTCAISASTRFMQRCASCSRRRTWPASCRGRGRDGIRRSSPKLGRRMSDRGEHRLPEGPRHGLREGDRTAGGPGPQRRAAAFFPCRDHPTPQRGGPRIAGIPRETRKPQARRPPLRSGRCRCARRCRPAPPAVW